jgi:isopenicillin N synthase-like dioxygenase
MPSGQNATVGHLETFILPDEVEGNKDNKAMAAAMIEAWRKTGIFQIQMTDSQQKMLTECFKTSKDFFQRPFQEKAKHVDDQSFAGYIASGEEVTDGIADYSEIFTVTKDLPQSDRRVQSGWPCHGPCPWPNDNYKNQMNQLMGLLGESGEKLLKLAALGLGLKNLDALIDMTEDGWHHMRILRFPHVDKTNGKGKKGRGIGSHTDYGLLVIAGQDDVGGLFIRPKIQGESIKNWQSSAAGLHEMDKNWLFVPPVKNTLTVFPGKISSPYFEVHHRFNFVAGDMMQFLTNDFLPSTPHKVGLNTAERFAFAYFHEPNFSSIVEPLSEYREKVHYGTHFTNMFMRNYPERVTAKRVHEENRLSILADLKKDALAHYGVTNTNT